MNNKAIILLTATAVCLMSITGCTGNKDESKTLDLKWLSNKQELIYSGACGGDSIEELISLEIKGENQKEGVEVLFTAEKGEIFDGKEKLDGKFMIAVGEKKNLRYSQSIPKDYNFPGSVEISFKSDGFEPVKLVMQIDKNEGCPDDVGAQTKPFIDSDTLKPVWFKDAKEFNEGNPVQWAIFNGYDKDSRFFYKMTSNELGFDFATGEVKPSEQGKNRIWIESSGNRKVSIMPDAGSSSANYYENGEWKWTASIPNLPEFYLPFLTETSFVHYLENRITCLDLRDGKERWNAKVKYGETLNFAQFGFGEGKLVASGDDWLVCFDETTGKELWSFKADNKSDKDGMPSPDNRYFTLKPIVTKDRVWVAISDPPGDFYHPYKVRCYDAATGKILFDEDDKLRTADEHFEIRSIHGCAGGVVVSFWQGGFQPEPDKFFIRHIDKNFIAADIQAHLMATQQGKFITFESSNGMLKSLDIENNAVLWTFEIGGKINATSEYPWVGSEAFKLTDDDKIFVGYGNNVFALDAADGKLLWTGFHKDMIPVDFVVIGDSLFIHYQKPINANNAVFAEFGIGDGKLRNKLHPFFGGKTSLYTFLGRLREVPDYIVDMRKIDDFLVLVTNKYVICYKR